MKLSGSVGVLDEHHRVQFLRGGGKTVGLVLYHDRFVLDDPQNQGGPGEWVECQPGKIQWEPYGELQPLFTVVSGPGEQLSVEPHIICGVCHDAGYIRSGKWSPIEIPSMARFMPEEEKYDEDEEDTGFLTGMTFGRRLDPAIEGEEDGDADAEPDLRDLDGILDDHRSADRKDHSLVEFGEGFALQDSGERRTYESGAQRDRAVGKGRYDLLQFYALDRIAKILEAGAIKYSERNWERGMPVSNYIDSALRHTFQYLAGLRDEDHLGQAAWNLLSAIHTEEMIAKGQLPGELFDLPNYDGLDLDERLPRKDKE